MNFLKCFISSLLLLSFGCSAPQTLVKYQEADAKTGIVTRRLEIASQKEITTDELHAMFVNGTLSFDAKNLKSRSQGIITAEGKRITAQGEAVGTTVKSLGNAAGLAGGIILGTEAIGGALQGAEQLVGAKVAADEAIKAAASAPRSPLGSK